MEALNMQRYYPKIQLGAFRSEENEHCPEVDVNKPKKVGRIVLTKVSERAYNSAVPRKKLTRKDVIQMLKQKQGERSINQFSKELGISQPHLSDIYNGKCAPGEKVLSILGLVKSASTYEVA